MNDPVVANLIEKVARLESNLANMALSIESIQNRERQRETDAEQDRRRQAKADSDRLAAQEKQIRELNDRLIQAGDSKTIGAVKASK